MSACRGKNDILNGKKERTGAIRFGTMPSASEVQSSYVHRLEGGRGDFHSFILLTSSVSLHVKNVRKIRSQISTKNIKLQYQVFS